MFPKFDSIKVCVKCGYDHGLSKPVKRYNSVKNLLERTCRICGFSWFELCADNSEPTTKTISYMFYWINGEKEILVGEDATDALNRAYPGRGSSEIYTVTLANDIIKFEWVEGMWCHVFGEKNE